MKKLLGVVWGFACAAVLVMTLMKNDESGGGDVGIFLIWGMLVLCFPVSLLVAALLAMLIIAQEGFEIRTLDLVDSSSVGFVVVWLVFVAAGYWQWFQLVPRIWRRWRGGGLCCRVLSPVDLPALE